MYYGIDSATAVFPSGASNHTFYIGRIGTGTTADSSSYFNDDGASLASYVYSYWGIKGPQSDPNYKSVSDYTTTKGESWGSSQAIAANTAKNNKANINRWTVFADIELGFGGWFTSSDTSNYAALNYAVFQGFIDKIKTYTPANYSGVYTSKGA